MTDMVTNDNQTEPRLLQLLTIIGELKTVNFKLLKSVKNTFTDRMATKKYLELLLIENYLKLTDLGNCQLSGKSFELLRNRGIHTKHMERTPTDSNAPHPWAVKRFLLPMMFWDTYHAVGYKRLKEHHLEPDAIVFFNCPIEGYEIVFVEVERTDKGADYLLDKYKKYQALGQDENTWSGWWHKYHKEFSLPYCKKEDFKFSVICQGNKTFELEGWEWI